MQYNGSKGRLYHSITNGIALSVIADKVAAEISVSYLSFICAEISLKLIPSPYIPIIFRSSFSANIVSLLHTVWGSKSPSQSRGVDKSRVPSPVFNSLEPYSFLRFPFMRSASSRCWLSFASRADSKNAFSIGAKAPSLPNKLLPERSYSRVFFSWLHTQSWVVAFPCKRCLLKFLNILESSTQFVLPFKNIIEIVGICWHNRNCC